MNNWHSKRDTMGDDPPYLAVGTEVSAKYKGAFCEAKIRKVVRSVKCKVLFKQGLGSATVTDDQIKGTLRGGSLVEVKHPEKKEFLEASITKIQDCSQYTVVFDDGDITTLRRSALCLKSGRHFAESETLDQLPLTHPEHFSNPVIGGRRGRRNRNGVEESSDEDEPSRRGRGSRDEKEADIGRVVCVEGGDKKKQKDNWFPGLVVAPTAQDTVRIHVKDEYLVRSFKDGRYYTVPKKEATEFTREIGLKVDNHTLRAAVDKALLFLDRDELPPHWDRDLLFGLIDSTATDSDPGFESDSSDDEPREEKDHFVAQLYKFMDERGTPINKGPTISSRDVDLYRLFKVVNKLGGYNRVTNHNHWKTVSQKIGFGQNPMTVNLVKHAYKKFLHSFEDFYRKLGCTMVNHPRTNRNRNKTGRSLIRDRDRATPVISVKTEPKEKSSEKEEAVAGPSSLNQGSEATEVKVKVEPEDNDILEETSKDTPRTKASESKEKICQKKVNEPHLLTKVKEEKPEEIKLPLETKDITKKTKPRKNQQKTDNKNEKKADKEGNFKEKKKRLFSRVTVKKDKTPRVTKSTTLAVTRQKRTMKDRVKALVDKLKMKITKDPAIVGIQDTVEKNPQGTKLKLKEEVTSSNKSKKEEQINSTTVNEEKKKVGRKRKERQDTCDEMLDVLPTYKTINVGDKLKVYYGPTHESKVTYEAKVLNVRGEGAEATYFVHYTGWNTRYDEWIKNSRIADNLSWTGGRAPRKQNSHPKSNKRKSPKGEAGGRSTPSSITSSSSKTKSRILTKSKASLSESEEYDSENTDMDPTSSKLRSERFHEESSKDSCKDDVVDNVIEKKRGKRKLEDDETLKIEKKRHEEKFKLDISEIPEGITTDKLKKDKKKIPDRKIEKDEVLSIDKTKIRIDKKKGETEEKSVEKNIPEQLVCVETQQDMESEDKKKSRKKIEKVSEQCDEISRKRKSWDKKSGFDGQDVKNDPVHETEDEVIEKKNKTIEKEGNISSKRLRRNETDDDINTIGRDFDLNQIRSELKGIDRTIKISTEEKTEKDSSEDVTNKEIEEEEPYETEDVYEFKEPEPFHFEVRKVSEDKSKLPRRSLGRMLEELKPTNVKKKNRPTFQVPQPEVKKRIPPSDLKKDSPDLNSNPLQNLEPCCEETFDKLCSSPLRAATEETSDLKIFNELPVEDDDELDEDSEDRLVISEHESDSEALFTHQYRNHEEMFPTKIGSSTIDDGRFHGFADYNTKVEVKIESKDDFTKEVDEVDDDEDDDMEDEAINVAIQRAICQETTDESNEEDLFLNRCSPKMEQIELDENEEEKKSQIKHDNSIEDQQVEIKRVDIEKEVVNDNQDANSCVEPFNEATNTFDDNSKEVIEEKQEIVQQKENDKLEGEITVEKPIDTDLKEVGVVFESVEPLELTESSDTTEEPKENETCGGNLASLLCEETIPGSPAPHIETIEEIEEKEVVTESNCNKDPVSINEEERPLEREVEPSPDKEAAPVMDNTPPTTPESPLSSVSVSPRGERSVSSPPLDNESTKSHRDSEVEMETYPVQKEHSDEESRIDTKPEVSPIPPVKKGRRPRKCSEDATKKKFLRAARHHHGSDSDDTSENSVGVSNRLEAPSRPQRPSKYNFIVHLGPELDGSQRVSVLLQTLQDLRKVYASVKAELASIDRRRKKLRKREREKLM